MTRWILISLILCSLFVSGNALAESEYDWFDIIYFSGYGDMRANYQTFKPNTDNEDDEITTSDIYIFEAALETHADITGWVMADVVIYYSDFSLGDNTGREEELTIDEYFISLTGWGLFGTIGKYYLPVGDFTSYGTSDTMVENFVQARASAFGLGYDFIHKYTEKPVFGLSGHLFNGDFDNVTLVDGEPEVDDDMISDFATHLYFAPTGLSEAQGYDLEFGAYYLSDCTETFGNLGQLLLMQDIAATADTSDDVVLYEKDVPLFGGYIAGEFHFNEMIGLGLDAEYAATGEFNDREYLDASGTKTGISVIHGDLALLIHQRNLQIGGRYDSITGIDFLETGGLDPEFEPVTYGEYGGYIGVDYIDHLHLIIQGLMGADNESNATTKIEFSALVEF